MKHKGVFLSVIMLTMLLAGPSAARAQQSPGPKEPQPPSEALAVTTSRQLSDFLPDKLAGVRATGEVRQFGPDGLAELVGDRTVIYQENHVVSAASRQYGPARIDIFQAENTFAALGLYDYVSGVIGKESLKSVVGPDSTHAPDQTVLLRHNYLVRITGAAGIRPGVMPALASAIGKSLGPETSNAQRPPLLESLPAESIIAESKRYFLGPESFNTFVERGREMFDFAGRAEAVMAEYKSANPSSNLKLVIVEYHTPQFASDAMSRVNGYLGSLPVEEQNRLIVKRVGNYIVQAMNFEDRQAAERLVDSVEYPYTVKWLRNPLWATDDPYRMQKAAQMLISTFGLLGLMILTVLVIGGVFGTTIFLKRRKLQQEIFSDAGGMLRLELDPIEASMLALPPKRREE